MHLKCDSYLHTFFLRSVTFPYNFLCTQAVAYTTYFELAKPVNEPINVTRLKGFRRSFFSGSMISRSVPQWSSVERGFIVYFGT